MTTSEVTRVNDKPEVLPGGRVLVVGATGDMGRATVRALLQRGRDVVCIVRPGYATGGSSSPPVTMAMLKGAEVRFGEVADPISLMRDGFRSDRFDAVVSCLASRTGAPRDAWAVDYRANLNVLEAAKSTGVGHLVLLSALCVQKPRLAFQHAKLAFEDALRSSGLRYSIVRPTAFFKSLAGQIDRVRRGKPFVMFGDGALTSCKPISDDDLASYMAGCLEDEARWDRILPIGGPGEAITPREQGAMLFALLGRHARYRSVPISVLDLIIPTLAVLSRVVPSLADKAEFARIGRYYATESMLVLDPVTARYDAAATPSTGTKTLQDFYTEVLAGALAPKLGDHAFFDRDAQRL